MCTYSYFKVSFSHWGTCNRMKIQVVKLIYNLQCFQFHFLKRNLCVSCIFNTFCCHKATSLMIILVFFKTVFCPCPIIRGITLRTLNWNIFWADWGFLFMLKENIYTLPLNNALAERFGEVKTIQGTQKSSFNHSHRQLSNEN
jgi:hypothetical protein